MVGTHACIAYDCLVQKCSHVTCLRYEGRTEFYFSQSGSKLQVLPVHMHVCMLSHLSHVWLCDPMDCSPSGSSVHGSLQECWSGLPCPPPGDLPNLGIEPRSPALQADSLPLSYQGSPTQCTHTNTRTHTHTHTHTCTLYCKENAPERGQMKRKRVDLLKRHKITWKWISVFHR